MESRVESAEVVLPCEDLSTTLDWFTGVLGFRLELIFPADDPRVAVVSGHGLRLRLDRDHDGEPGTLLLRGDGDIEERTAPNGTRICGASTRPDLPEGEQGFVISRMNEDAQWIEGRAGMRYRDLIPGRQGGRFIASHIQIPDGGPVPDYVHYHHVRFQFIYCWKGWVRVVYQDQGAPFVLEAGDLVLQPPGIRHRVLESSPGLEVIEVGCPAEHETWTDHDMELPTTSEQPDRLFGGQRFVRFRAAGAEHHSWQGQGFQATDTGIRTGTDGLAEVRIVRAQEVDASSELLHEGEFCFLMVLHGCLGVSGDRLRSGDACTIPPDQRFRLVAHSDDLEFLEVFLPSDRSSEASR